MNATKIRCGLPLVESGFDFLLDCLGSNPVLQILHQFPQGGAVIVPAARTAVIGVEIGKLALEFAKHIAKCGDILGLLGLHHPQSDVALLHATDFLLPDARRRPQEDCSRHTPCRHECAVAGVSSV